jgi:hypothetical protein
MGALLRSVPREMWATLGSKKTVKEAWGAVKSMRQGADRVKEAHAQRLLQEFENFACKDGELVDDFAMRINTLTAELRVLGETMPENKVVRKLLRSLPRRFSQIGVSIETLLDVNTMTIEDLVGRLKAAKDWLDVDSVTERAGRLLLSEEEWLSKYRHRLTPEGSSSGSGEKKTGGSGKQKGGARGDKKEPVVKFTSEGTPRRKGRCRNCGIYGHWKEDCKRPPRKERKEEAHHAQADTDQAALLLATVNAVHVQPRDVEPPARCMTRQVVHLNEKKVLPGDHDEDRDVWVLDTGASNHMTGCHEALDGHVSARHGALRRRITRRDRGHRISDAPSQESWAQGTHRSLFHS